MADCEKLAKSSGVWDQRRRQVFGTHGKTPSTARKFVYVKGKGLVEQKK